MPAYKTSLTIEEYETIKKYIDQFLFLYQDEDDKINIIRDFDEIVESVDIDLYTT